LNVQLGTVTDKPVPADYDGDGRADPAVMSPNGTWTVRPSGGGADIVQAWGIGSDRPGPAGFAGGRRAHLADFRPFTGHWIVKLSNTGATLDVALGVSSDRLVPGDYDGDGRTDMAVFRPSEGKWYVRPSAGGADIVSTFGVSTDKLPWKFQ